LLRFGWAKRTWLTMNGVAEQSWSRARSTLRLLSAASPNALTASVSQLLFGLQLGTSACFALYVAFWLELDNACWAGASAAIMRQPQLGASLRTEWFRLDQRLASLPRSEAEPSLSERARVSWPWQRRL
jgi:hypothetical protein